MVRPSLEKNLNALEALIIACVLSTALILQLFFHEEPCALCLLQRLGMLGVATGALLNVRFGSHKAHYGLCLLAAVFGGFVSLRQIALHVCPDFPKFGIPFWGLSLYTWAFILFATSVAYNGLLLMCFDRTHGTGRYRLNWFGHIAFVLLFLVAFINIFSTYALCGFGPCQ